MQEAPAEPRVEPASGTCPRCGSPAVDGQLVCLECGAPIGLRHRPPPDWRIGAAVVAAVVAIAVIVFVAALDELSGDAEREVSRPSLEPPPAEPDETSGGIPVWPDGLRAYTVVLRETRSRDSAGRRARRALRAGIEAGLARSDDFTSLREGRWIAFAGRFQSLSEAEAAAETYAARGFRGGEPRLLAPEP